MNEFFNRVCSGMPCATILLITFLVLHDHKLDTIHSYLKTKRL